MEVPCEPLMNPRRLPAGELRPDFREAAVACETMKSWVPSSRIVPRPTHDMGMQLTHDRDKVIDSQLVWLE